MSDNLSAGAAAEDEDGKIVHVACYAHKGGVGKSTLAINMAATFVEQTNKRALLVDADPQRNSSHFLIKAIAVESKFGGFDYDYYYKKPKKEKGTWEEYRNYVDIALSAVAKFITHPNRKKPKRKIHFCKEELTSEEVHDRKRQIDEENDHTDDILVYREIEDFDDCEGEWRILSHNPLDNKLSSIALLGCDDVLNKDFNTKLDDGTCTDKELENAKTKLGVRIHAHAESDCCEYANYIFDQLIHLTLYVKDALPDGESNLERCFVLTKDSVGGRDAQRLVWKLYYYNYKGERWESTISDMRKFKELMAQHDGTPESLKDDPSAIAEIISYLKWSLHYNFLDAFNVNALTGAIGPNKLLERVNHLHLLELKNPLFDETDAKANGSGPGSILVLPGSQHLLLRWGRNFSSAFSDLRGGNEASANTIYIKAANHFIREVAEANGVDLVLTDLSPSADDLNAVLFMGSDYFVTAVNPEAFSDEAIEGLRTICESWRSDFDKMYAQGQREISEFGPRGQSSSLRPLVEPPKCLGVVPQRVTYDGSRDKVWGVNASAILDRIKKLYDHSFIPTLYKLGMYPTKFRLPDYDEQGRPNRPKFRRGIPGFVDAFKGTHLPAVWAQSSDSEFVRTAFYHTTSRILAPPVRYHCGDWPEIVERVRDRTPDPDEPSFDEFWVNEYKKSRESIDPETDEAVEAIKNEYFCFDALDMMFALSFMRHEKTRKSYPNMGFEEAVLRYFPNKDRVLVVNPTITERFGDDLMSALANVLECWPRGTRKLEWIIIPVMVNANWCCLRVHLNIDDRTLKFLYDDPRGGKIVVGEKQAKSSRNMIDKTSLDSLIRPVNEAVRKYVRTYKDDMNWDYAPGEERRTLFCKLLDQQGYLYNNVDSGPIILSNIDVYMESNQPHEKFVDEAVFYDLLDVLSRTDHNYRVKEVKFGDGESIKASYSLYKISEAPRSKLSNPGATKYRKKFAGFLKKIGNYCVTASEDNPEGSPYDFLFNIVQDTYVLSRISICDSLSHHYKGIGESHQKQYEAWLNKVVETIPPWLAVAALVAELLFTTYGRSRPARTNEKNDFTKGPLNDALKRVKKKFTCSDGDVYRRSRKRSVESPAIVAKSPRLRSSRYSRSDLSSVVLLDDAAETGDVDLPAGLEKFGVAGDGHCFYNSALVYFTDRGADGVDSLRDDVADQLNQGREYYEDFVNLGSQTWEQYISNVRSGNEYAQEAEIRIVAGLYNGPIVIVCPGEDSNSLLKRYRDDQGEEAEVDLTKSPMFVFYDPNSVHYSMLTVKQDYDGSAIMQQMISDGELNDGPQQLVQDGVADSEAVAGSAAGSAQSSRARSRTSRSGMFRSDSDASSSRGRARAFDDTDPDHDAQDRSRRLRVSPRGASSQ